MRSMKPLSLSLVAASALIACSSTPAGATDAPSAATLVPDRASVEAGKFQKPSPAEIEAGLSPLEYRVTQKSGTERPYSHPYAKKKYATTKRSISYYYI